MEMTADWDEAMKGMATVLIERVFMPVTFQNWDTIYGGRFNAFL